MKRLFIILAFIVMSLTMNAQVEVKGGLLKRSDVETENSNLFIRKQSTQNDANTTNDTDVPVGSGLMLIGFGTAYALYKRNKQ